MLQRARGLDLVDVISAPTSVVVVGASVATESRAGRALAYLNRLGYEGAIHVVHPREDSILGYPAVRQVADLPLSIDMAMINTPAESVPLLVRELDDRGVRVAISIASGFEDRSLPIRRELSDAISERTIRLIGPNCTGVMAPASAGYLSTSSFLQHYTPRLGGIALVSQSGGMGNGLLATAFKRGAGISHLITTGDEIDVGCLEVIAGLLRRTDVTAVGALIEGVTDHEWLEHVALGIKETEKRVYFLRMAKTDAGRVAAGAHTGRVVGQADIATAVLGEAGMVEVSNMEELGDVLLCSDLFRPPARGRVSIVSCSGASAALAADQVGMSLNLSIPQPLAESMQVSKAEFDLALNFANPLDVPGHDTLRFARALVLARELPDFDAVLGISTSLAHDPDVLIAELGSGPRPRTPLLLTFLSPDDSFAAEKVAALARHGTATIPTPQRAIRAWSF